MPRAKYSCVECGETTWSRVKLCSAHRPNPTIKITDQQIRQAVAERLTIEQIAARFGASTRAVLRAKHRARLPMAERPRVTLQELDRVYTLAAEGMPLTWATEGSPHDVTTFREYLKTGIPEDWPAVWAEIRNNPVLKALHDEFAPR